MLYSISRETPEKDLEQVSAMELDMIALKVKALGLEVEVYN